LGVVGYCLVCVNTNGTIHLSPYSLYHDGIYINKPTGYVPPAMKKKRLEEKKKRGQVKSTRKKLSQKDFD